MTLFLLWIGTYCISCVVQQTSGEKDLSSLVRDDDSSLAAIRHVQSIIPVVRPRPNIRSHSVLFDDFSLVLNVRRLCVVVDSLISDAKVSDCVISAWCWNVCDRVVELRFRQNILCQT